VHKKSKNSYFKKLSFPDLARGAFLPMTCPVCNEEVEFSDSEYCLAHQRALENVRQAFEKWIVAYGNLTLPDFLQRVQKAPGMGPKVKEVARFVFENPSRWKC
jgi:hypothetical protein